MAACEALGRGSPLLPQRLQRNSLKLKAVRSERLENEAGRRQAGLGLAKPGFLPLDLKADVGAVDTSRVLCRSAESKTQLLRMAPLPGGCALLLLVFFGSISRANKSCHCSPTRSLAQLRAISLSRSLSYIHREALCHNSLHFRQSCGSCVVTSLTSPPPPLFNVGGR